MTSNPPGFVHTSKQNKQQQRAQSLEERDLLKVKKAWELAIAPAKAMPMQAFMMYMSGSTPQIFSMMMTFMFFSNPIKAMASMDTTFAKLDTPTTHARLLLPKLAFIAIQILTILVGIWKCSSMGLLPTHRSDWLAWETQSTPLETSFAATPVS